MVNKVSHTATIMQPLLMVESLERLAGAVGLLSGHVALVRVQGGGVVLGVFGGATPGEGAVSAVLQIHAEVEFVWRRVSVGRRGECRGGREGRSKGGWGERLEGPPSELLRRQFPL